MRYWTLQSAKSGYCYPLTLVLNNAEFFLHISTSVLNMAAGKRTHNWKRLENPTLRVSVGFKTHENKIPTAVPMLSKLTFSMATIHR